jgi:hypothetical protein
MANKIVLKKDGIEESKPIVNQDNQKNIPSDKLEGKKQKKSIKKSSGVVIDSVERRAVSQVKATSSKDVRGSSGLANTGTIISYD